VEIEPVEGTPVRFPPGRVAIRLNERHRRAYRALYAHYRTVLDGLPVLRERDFDGRAVKVTPAQLDALNRAFASLGATKRLPANVFDAQERSRQGLFKRLQYLS
jgi:hypothetical protein